MANESLRTGVLRVHTNLACECVQKKFKKLFFFDFLVIFFLTRAHAQAFIGRKLDRSSSISYQIIILEFFFHGRTECRIAGMPEGQDTP